VIRFCQTGEPWLAFYGGVSDPQATLDKAESLRGTREGPIRRGPPHAVGPFRNPVGNVFSVCHQEASCSRRTGAPAVR
jgi:hypothetical protein